jgi:hypothetical protein
MPGMAGAISAANTVKGTKRKNRNQKADTCRPERINPASLGKYVTRAIPRIVSSGVIERKDIGGRRKEEGGGS